MKTFRIEGGHQLKGDIQPQGAKNEALQIIDGTEQIALSENDIKSTRCIL